MKAARLLLIGIIAVLALGSLGPSAYARRHKQHIPKSPKYHYKPDKNAYLFGGKYKTPKKQHAAKHSHYGR